MQCLKCSNKVLWETLPDGSRMCIMCGYVVHKKQGEDLEYAEMGRRENRHVGMDNYQPKML